ncbi:ankyrin repeat domain-containing protein [Helicobacter sp. 23-1045]
MKKLSLALLIVGFLAQVAFAFPPDFCYECKPYLSNKGVMSKNTLKRINCADKFANMACFSGEVELTGVVVSAYHNEYDENFFQTRFYPDNNLDLPFLRWGYCDGGVFDEKMQRLDCSKVKVKFERLDFGVLLKIDSKKVFLPKAIADKHLGESRIRAKVRLKDYSFYGEGEAGHDAYATLIEFSPLGKVYEHYEDGGEFISLKYGSKDSFVNLRDKPNGNIIAQIKREDMRCGAENDEILWADYPPDTKIEKLPQNKWLEVFYYPLNAKKPQEAIYGYIHSSQLKLSCDSQDLSESAQDLSKNQLLCEAIWQSNIKATKSDIEAIKQALQSGANVNTADCNGRSAFDKSVYSGRFDIALYLVKNKNFDVNMRYDNGDTPLIIAVDMNCEIRSSECESNDKIYEIAKLLMQKGANPYMKNKERISAISLAESEGCGCEYKPDNKMLKILQGRSSKK